MGIRQAQDRSPLTLTRYLQHIEQPDTIPRLKHALKTSTGKKSEVTILGLDVRATTTKADRNADQDKEWHKKQALILSVVDAHGYRLFMDEYSN